MVSFRPHTLNLIRSNGGSYDEFGRFIPGSDFVVEGVECRYEPNGKANTIVLEDGKTHVYSFMVYLSVDCPDISYGDVIELFKQDGTLVGRFTAQGFHRGQLNARLWL